MNILEAFCGVLLVHFVGATSTDYTCTTKTYASSIGLSCYPCPPGFYVDKECMENATNNKCKPCPTGEFHSTCAEKSKTCKECGPCQEGQKITRNCTTTKDNTCACKNENHCWDTLERVCLNTCQRGKKITQGDEGEGLLCVPCETDTFSNERNSSKCEAVKNCTKTSVISSSSCEECNHSERVALIVVSVLAAIFITCLVVLIKCEWQTIKRKWQTISKDFHCCEKCHKEDGTDAGTPPNHGKDGEKFLEEDKEQGPKVNFPRQESIVHDKGPFVSLDKAKRNRMAKAKQGTNFEGSPRQMQETEI